MYCGTREHNIILKKFKKFVFRATRLRVKLNMQKTKVK